jgi:hypothetical protein
MPSRDPSWQRPPLSTDSAEAVACYQQGIAALVAGIAHAETYLTQAATIDPAFYLAQVGIAAARVVAGELYTAPPIPARALTLGERQHAEIIEAALTGHAARAANLRREHLSEYPCDLLIVWLPALVEDLSRRSGRA